MTDLVLILILVILVSAGIYMSIRKLTRGGGCCGEREQNVKKIRFFKREKQLDQTYVFEIQGMTCENCARRIQNALNALPNVSARVNISTHMARVHCSDQFSPSELEAVIASVGYHSILHK